MKDYRSVSTEEGKKLSEEFGLPFNETSAKDGININETFEDLVERIDSNYSKLELNDGKPIKNKLYKGNKNRILCC